MIGHTKDAKSMKMFYDSILSSCPGLSPYLKVIGSDGENSIISESCAAFPASVLLLCMRHAHQNIERKLLELRVPIEMKKKTKEDIFGSHVAWGLVHCSNIRNFEECANSMLDSWLSENNESINEFAEYFRRHKLEQFQYHVSAAAVASTGIMDYPDFFTTTPVSSWTIWWRIGKKRKFRCERVCRVIWIACKSARKWCLQSFSRNSKSLWTKTGIRCLQARFQHRVCMLSLRGKARNIKRAIKRRSW